MQADDDPVSMSQIVAWWEPIGEKIDGMAEDIGSLKQDVNTLNTKMDTIIEALRQPILGFPA